MNEKLKNYRNKKNSFIFQKLKTYLSLTLKLDNF